MQRSVPVYKPDLRDVTRNTARDRSRRRLFLQLEVLGIPHGFVRVSEDLRASVLSLRKGPWVCNIRLGGLNFNSTMIIWSVDSTYDEVIRRGLMEKLDRGLYGGMGERSIGNPKWVTSILEKQFAGIDQYQPA